MEVNDRKTTGHPFNTSCYKTIKSDIKEDKKLMLKKKNMNDSYVINAKTQNVTKCHLNIAPELNNLHTIENMSL